MFALNAYGKNQHLLKYQTKLKKNTRSVKKKSLEFTDLAIKL